MGYESTKFGYIPKLGASLPPGTITGNLTPGYLPVASAATVLIDSPLYYAGGIMNVNGSTSTSRTRFPNAQFISSQAASADTQVYQIGLVGEALAVGTNQGIGVYGVGQTLTTTVGVGVRGTAKVSASTDAANAIGVSAFSTDTHASGNNIGLLGNASGGANNYALYMMAGNIFSNVTQTWALATGTSALNIAAGLVNVDTSNTRVGINTTTPQFTLDVAGTGQFQNLLQLQRASNTNVIQMDANTNANAPFISLKWPSVGAGFTQYITPLGTAYSYGVQTLDNAIIGLSGSLGAGTRANYITGVVVAENSRLVSYAALNTSAANLLLIGVSGTQQYTWYREAGVSDKWAAGCGVGTTSFDWRANSQIMSGGTLSMTLTAAGKLTVLSALYGSGLGTNVTTATVTVALNETHSLVLVDTTTAPVTITLPTSVGSGRIYTIKKIAGANNVTIAVNGGGTIDGAASVIISTMNLAQTVQFDGTTKYYLI